MDTVHWLSRPASRGRGGRSSGSIRDRITLTFQHMLCMVIHMKTTLNIDDTVMASLRREAARSGRTMSELVETALRQLLRRRPGATELVPLPTFDSGGALVDISDRDALYRAMEER